MRLKTHRYFRHILAENCDSLLLNIKQNMFIIVSENKSLFLSNQKSEAHMSARVIGR